MLKRMLLSGALLCAPMSAQAGGFWDDAFSRPASAVHTRKAKAAGVDHRHVSRARASVLLLPDGLSIYTLETLEDCGIAYWTPDYSTSAPEWVGNIGVIA